MKGVAQVFEVAWVAGRSVWPLHQDPFAIEDGAGTGGVGLLQRVVTSCLDRAHEVGLEIGETDLETPMELLLVYTSPPTE